MQKVTENVVAQCDRMENRIKGVMGMDQKTFLCIQTKPAGAVGVGKDQPQSSNLDYKVYLGWT